MAPVLFIYPTGLVRLRLGFELYTVQWYVGLGYPHCLRTLLSRTIHWLLSCLLPARSNDVRGLATVTLSFKDALIGPNMWGNFTCPNLKLNTAIKLSPVQRRLIFGDYAGPLTKSADENLNFKNQWTRTWLALNGCDQTKKLCTWVKSEKVDMVKFTRYTSPSDASEPVVSCVNSALLRLLR
jgi:hypothetical protein